MLSTESVGRVGELRLEYAKRDHQTVITRSYCTTPWHLLPPIYLDETGSAYTLLVNPSGGLVGGDGLSIDMNLDRDAHVLISSPSANRVYRSEGKLSEQIITLTVGPGAILEWLPEHTIPFAGSRFRQSIHATLASGATIVLWDALASGRMARDERWAFTDLENEIHITTASGEALVERYALEPASDLGCVGLVEEWDYVASFYIVNDAVSPEIWAELESKCAAMLENLPGQVLGGVSTPPVPGLAIKLLARTAPDLTHMLDLLWAKVREALWNLPPVSLRKY
ncbi:MAG: urease accessory protein UreD [Nitrospira sp.]|nr:urease accessory protein UreD [Nitrospira sp.]MDH4357516.1 urease accessory protein UreD [Nitrospira sp.]